MYGEEGEYFWVDHLDSVGDVLRDYPEVVVRHRVVITAFDSGTFRASAEEVSQGWVQRGVVVVSALIRSSAEVPTSGEGDELWVYGEDEVVPSFPEWEHLGGYSCITLANPELRDLEAPSEDEEWLRAHRAKLQNVVRAGLKKYRPLTFLRDDLIATRDPVLVEALRKRLVEASRCHCEVRGNACWITPSMDDFAAPYELIALSTASVSGLYRCRSCSTGWIIASGRERRLSIALRIEGAEHWESTDIAAAQRDLLTRRDGKSEQLCRWAKCGRRALKDREICADHSYPLGPAERISQQRFD
ncbi:MAG: hypothetical protein ACI9KE_002951 [Polyangiales bacterium]